MLVSRFGTVRPFLKILVEVVDFGATPEGFPVLAALQWLPELMSRKKVVPAEIDAGLLVGSWRRLVLSAPHLEPGMVDWKAYTFCVLEQLHRMLRSKQVFAKNSSKWGDPRAKLLAGEAWEQARPTVLASLGLPGQADKHLAARAALLDVSGGRRASADNAQIAFDDDGRLHFAALEPEPEPASLLDLRAAVNALLPRVDVPEVFSWTGADQAFTSVTGGEARLRDLHVTIAALLVAHGCNVGYTPVIGGVDALKYGRLSHVDQTYLRLATHRAANATLIEHRGVHRSRPGVGRWACRLGGRDAVLRPGAERVSATEPEVLLPPGRRHLAQHDQRPGRRARREGRGRHPARLPVRAGRSSTTATAASAPR
ncbi:Tn3 family transposase [Streptomyces sp. Midd1]|uniref:Tn3 family transposase n=1 Tax=Streptomyces sp. Midd3 TaxID=3161191 RepID=UPI0034DAF89E